jgi:hypothetical protein
MVSLNLPTKNHARDWDIVVCQDEGVHEYKFNLGALLENIESIISKIDGDDVSQMPTHEDVSKVLKRSVGYA